MADKEDKVVFGGRLGEYRYYDMDAVIASALDMCEKELGV
ncbi:uDP-galactopyranose mutase [Blautia sp. CAG:257]|nr:uDP-galactopyranose mutase [Blautia sp. CAG:257]